MYQTSLTKISVTDQSQFDTLPAFDKMPIKARNINENTGYVFVASANPSVTGVVMAKTFYDQGSRAMMHLSKSIEEFKALKDDMLDTEPIVAITELNIEILHKIQELVNIGYVNFTLYVPHPANEVNIIQRIEAMGCRLYVAVSSVEEIHALNKTSCKIDLGFILKVPIIYSGYQQIDMETIPLIKSSLKYDYQQVLVEEEVFKPLDAVKAIALGADGVILADVLLAGSAESQATEISYNLSDLKEFSLESGERCVVDKTGSVSNILMEFESALRSVMSMTGSDTFSELRKKYRLTLDKE